MVATAATSTSFRDRVFEILAHVPDPEIPAVSVVDLGIVRDVTDEAVTITPTYTGCPATLAIEADIRTALEPNLCRCGTHMRILKSVQRARELMKSASATPVSAG